MADRRLQVFHAVAKHLSFTKAADALFMTQPAVPTLCVGNSEAVQDRVAERTLDLGFIEGDSHLSSLLSEACCEDELQVVCAPSHPLAKEPFALPLSLIQYPYVGREAGSGTRA